jgi:hypothetical protein
MWYRTFSRLIVCAVLAALAGCGGGGGGPSAPLPAAIQPTASPTPNPGAAPTPPTSAGPSSATTQATYTSANPTVTLPTVGMIASQLTLPPGLVPDGTQLSISVSAGGASASSVARGRVHRAATIAGSAWTATITSPTNFALDASQMSVTLAVGSGIQTGGTMTFYAGSGTTLTTLGTVAADSSNAPMIVFDGASPCASNTSSSGSSQSGESGESNNVNTINSTGVTDSWNSGNSQSSGRVRRAQSGANCVVVAAASAPALSTGAFYVSDPGASAVLLFPSGANGNVEPYSPLAAAPLIATDFAGELINWRGGEYVQAEISPYGSSSLSDAIVAGTLNESARGVAADPIGAHVGLVGLDQSASTCTRGESEKASSNCPVAIEVFDRSQGGVAAPGVSSDVNLETYDSGMWLDPNDDAFIAGGLHIGAAGDFGAIEYVPNFGGLGYANGPFAVFPTQGAIAQITTDTFDNVYVASPNNGVYVFAPGTTVPGWSLPSSVLPNPSGPMGVGVDAQGNVYLSSPQLLNSDGSTVIANAAILVFPPITSWSGASTTPLRTVTGPATDLVSPGKLAIINTSPSSPPNSTIKLTPATVSFTAAGQSQSVGVSENGYSGTFSESDTCSGIATIANASGGFSVTAAAAGTCFATIADTNGNSTKLGVTVTTTSFTISSHGRP